MILVAALSLFVQPAGDFSVRPSPDGPVLIHNGHRRVFGLERVAAKLADGTSMRTAGSRNGTLDILVRGRKVAAFDFQKELEEWLDVEAIWGGHKAANDVRYLARAGVVAEISEIVPTQRSSALIILTMRYSGPSGQPPSEQFLILLKTAPKPMFQRLRRLPMEPGLSRSAPKRLIRYGGKLMLHERDLVACSDQGRLGKVLFDLPDKVRIEALSVGRWLVMSAWEREGALAYDLKTRQSRPLMPGGPSVWLTGTSESAPLAVVEESLGRSALVSLSQGRVLRRAEQFPELWREFFVEWNQDRIRVWYAVTGRLVANLAAPNGKRS